MADGSRLYPDIKFYEHQTEGIHWCNQRKSFILADQPGLGKTLQALACADFDFSRGYAEKMLVCCPASLKHNWLREINSFTSFDAIVLEGKRSERDQILFDFAGSGDIIIINYEQLSMHLDQFQGLRLDIAVFDEAHALKSFKSKRTAAAIDLRAKRKMFLTGTPMLATVTDLWPLFHMIWPRVYDNFYAFRNRFALMGGYQDKQVIGVKPERESELAEILEECMLRRRKSEVLDLPDKQYIQIWVPLHPEQQKMYDEALEELQITLPDDPTPLELQNALTKFLRLKQLASTTLNLTEEYDYSYKLDVVADRVHEVLANGKPTIVFTQFLGTNAALVNRLSREGVRVFQLTGATLNEDRSKVVDQWAATPNGVLVAQIQVAGVGLNMTEADTVIFAEKMFTPALNEQAVDRIHRIGQDSDQIQIIEVLAENTIEERAEEILNTKQREHVKVIDQGVLDKSAFYTAMKGVLA